TMSLAPNARCVVSSAKDCPTGQLTRRVTAAKEEVGDKLTVYLDGHEGHRGNVLLHSFVRKVHRLALVLGKLERAYLGAAKRQTDFEIIDADKVNPTTLTLQAVPHIRAYNPAP